MCSGGDQAPLLPGGARPQMTTLAPFFLTVSLPRPSFLVPPSSCRDRQLGLRFCPVRCPHGTIPGAHSVGASPGRVGVPQWGTRGPPDAGALPPHFPAKAQETAARGDTGRRNRTFGQRRQRKENLMRAESVGLSAPKRHLPLLRSHASCTPRRRCEGARSLVRGFTCGRGS